MKKLKKLVVSCYLFAALSSLTGCMGPLMHGSHGDYPDDPDANQGNHSSGHHH